MRPKCCNLRPKFAKASDIIVEKRIPAGGGFGGGSSDAATVLVALDALWGTDLGVERLAELGLQLGADVPVFVRGENAWAEGVGEQLQPDRAAAGLVPAGRPGRPRADRRAFPSP